MGRLRDNVPFLGWRPSLLVLYRLLKVFFLTFFHIDILF